MPGYDIFERNMHCNFSTSHFDCVFWELFENYQMKKFYYPDLEKHVLIGQPLHYHTCESLKFVKKTTNLNTF